MVRTARYLSVREVAVACSPAGKPVCGDRVRAWVRRCVKVRGSTRPPVRLRATRLPSGLAFAEADVEAFLLQLQEAERSRTGEQPKRARRPRGRLTPATPRGFRRCAPDEVGTYPRTTARDSADMDVDRSVSLPSRPMPGTPARTRTG